MKLFFFGYGAGLVLWKKRFLQRPHLSLSYNIFIFQKQQIVKIIKKQKKKNPENYGVQLQKFAPDTFGHDASLLAN